MPAPDGAMTIKRKVQTKYKLPSLNWIALKPNQVRNESFCFLVSIQFTETQNINEVYQKNPEGFI